uniref:NADH-ubiquinone oxidoreductase chain 1 n=1 Tax=Paratemnoides elongatus TaxID=51805 RepID=H9MFI1_9ARAC|nr:NADH dehydrogenase subunit 1 [Paratemnoides elongatus]AEX37726.1 NADH dehydrogenase subunit 1 [Paratemnoides elongatus]
MVVYLMLVLSALLGVVFFSMLERKILSLIQIRKGPNSVMLMGLLQSVVDAVKLFMKEQMKLYSVSIFIYLVSPACMAILSIFIWAFYPLSSDIFMFEYSMLLFVMVTSLEAYFLLFMGWFSSNKFSMMGSLRGVSQIISFEINIMLIILMMIYIWETASFLSVLKLQSEMVSGLWYLLYLAVLMFLLVVVELNRSPVDMVEGESELVSGFNIEYMSYGLSVVFISEFSGMIIMCFIVGSLFLCSFLLLALMLCFVLLIIRSVFPRVRYDLLMMFMWKSVLPLIMGLYYLYMLM